jgi:hypothetical protein
MKNIREFVKKMENLLKEAKGSMKKEESNKQPAKKANKPLPDQSKGVHKESYSSGKQSQSESGDLHRQAQSKGQASGFKQKLMGYVKDDHKQKLNELKSMPKPNLPKSEGKKEDNEEMPEKKSVARPEVKEQTPEDQQERPDQQEDESAEQQAPEMNDQINNDQNEPQEEMEEGQEESSEENSQNQSQYKYIAGDGDSIGAQVGQAMLHDDDEGLKAVSGKINQGQEMFAKWLSTIGGEMISAGGDEFVARVPAAADLSSLDQFRSEYESAVGATLTIGTGGSMSQAGKALIYGKLNGKDQVAEYDGSMDEYLHNVHSSQHEPGSEEDKQDEHYIGSMYDGEENSEHEMNDPEHVSDEHLDEPEQGFASQAGEQDQALGAANQVADGQVPVDEEAMDEQIGKDDDEIKEPMPGMVDDQMPVEANKDETPDENDEYFDANDDEALENEMEEPAGDEQEMPMDELPPQSDEDMPAEDNPIESTMSSSMQDGNGDYLKSQMMNVLQGFKRDKEFIEGMQSSSPETYQEIIGLLHQMIKVSKMLNQSTQPQEQMPAQEPVLQEPQNMADDQASANEEAPLEMPIKPQK